MEASLGLVLVISSVAVLYDNYTLAALGLFGITLFLYLYRVCVESIDRL